MTKHVLCLNADHEMALLSLRFNELKDFFTNKVAPWVTLLSPLLPQRISHREKTIQERMDNLEATVASVCCYIKFRRRLDNIPTLGEDGDHWYHGFKRTYRHVRSQYTEFCQSITLTMLAFVAMVRTDLARHPRFPFLASLDAAILVIREELLNLAGHEEEAWDRFWEPKLETMLARFPLVTPLGECFLIGTRTMSERVAVQQCAAAFRHVLWTWNIAHGLRLPRVRHLLERFAFDMEVLYDRRQFNLL
jgi:hypothetical protein